jgi:hypothetical protein
VTCPRLSLLLVLVLLGGACRSRQQPEQRTAPSATAKIVATAVETATRADLPPRFRLFHLFPKQTGIWSVGTRLVACESRCIFGWGKPPVLRTWLVSPQGVEQDVSLLPLQLKHISIPRVRYWGSYPNDVYALIELDHDSCDQHEVAFRYLGPGKNKRFVRSDPPEGSSLGSPMRGAFAPPESECESQCAPFGVYDAEEEAARLQRDGPNTSAPRREALRLSGHGGPPLVIDYKKFARWTGTSWERAEAPWCLPFGAVRLSNGSSLVVSWRCNDFDPFTSIFWISQRGQPQPLDLSSLVVEQRLGAIEFREALELNREIWLIAETDAGTALLAPMTPSELTRPAPRALDEGDDAR